jgi:hypothetical protein
MTNKETPKTRISGPNAYTDAERMARYGHRDWLTWRDKDGVDHADLVSAASIKAAMLACGTGRKFVLHQGSTRHRFIVSWRLASQMLRNARYIEQHPYF